VLKLPFTLRYENMDKNISLTREQAESILVDVLDYIRVNCEIRHKAIRKKKDSAASGKKKAKTATSKMKGGKK
jgi:hypothetical protein